MRKQERIVALITLAKKHLYAENVGYMWKNPRSRGNKVVCHRFKSIS